MTIFTNWLSYEALGIFEYWIVDYLALGAARYIGSPKTPTISVYQLVEGKYQVQQFRAQDRIKSPTCPELQLSTQSIFDAVGG